MVVPLRLERHERAASQTESHGIPQVYGADLDQCTPELPHKRFLNAANAAWRSRQAELKIFSTVQGKSQGVGLQRCCHLPDRVGDGNAGSFKLRSDAAGFTDMTQITRQAIANIKHAVKLRMLT
jgi:hypothetical protein